MPNTQRAAPAIAPVGEVRTAARPQKIAVIGIFLVLLVFAVFGQTARFGFVKGYDDREYVYKNPVVLKGLTLDGVGWAFTNTLVGHWHPLTVIALMAESQLFGMWAGGFHLVAVSLHAVSVLFLFLVLTRMTGAPWRSAFVAALFAIHPLRAESVAFVAECKDVLSAMFFMLTLWAYARYAERKSAGRYASVLVLFALGLLSKPMLVTLPCVLLLLDYWPLGRLRNWSQLRGLIREKAPLFLMSALSCVATLYAVKAGDTPTYSYPANISVAYVAYLWKFIYPVHLAALYPLPPEGRPAWQTYGALLLLAGITWAVYRARRKQPYLITGWFWYLGMTVPVVGVLQAANEAYADRYTYLPQIGLCFAGTWMAAEWAGARRERRAALGVIAGLILCALAVACWRQVTYWRDASSLWNHTIQYTRNNDVAYYKLGTAFIEEGRIAEGIAALRTSARIKPSEGRTHRDLANVLMQQGRLDEAIAEYRETLRIAPHDPETYNNLGNALYREGRFEEAIANYDEALRLKQDFGEAHFDLGAVLERQGQTEEAIAQFREAARFDPGLEPVYQSLGDALVRQRRFVEAVAEYRVALTLNPNDLGVEDHLAWVLATASAPGVRNGAEALNLAAGANRSSGGNNPVILRTLAAGYAATGDFANAVQTAQRALALAPSNTALADAIRADIKLYQAGQAIRD